MLVPVTRSRTLPNERTTSAANSIPSAFDASFTKSMPSRERTYEAFRLVRHGPDVALILPQANAIDSKTRSLRKAGFWYGFLAAAAPCGF
jgi:hypothetical protein